MADVDASNVVVDGSRDELPVSTSSWNPLGRAFRPYVSFSPSTVNAPESSSAIAPLRVIVKKPLVARLTKGIVETYQICNPSFKYSEALNPKRFLTNPSIGVLNDGYDNANSDLILHVNLELVNLERKRRYTVKDILGQGTFGQVAKCWDLETNCYVAVKIIKNQPAYYRQAVVEVSILHMLNQKFDPDAKHHIVRILDYFVFQRHLCISFEMLGSNLYELIKMNHFKGFSLSIVQMFSKQILHALIVMKDAGIIHCDMKPENILISTSVKPTEIKVIDFGSACMEGRTVYSYIQSRYYRSPEVVLGYPYTSSIDMWSLGCIVAELFLGLPLFPGASEYDLLKRMIQILGGQPPDNLLRDSKSTIKFFKHVGSIYRLENVETSKELTSAYRVLTEDEYEARESKRPSIGKNYFNHVKLEDIIANYPYRKNLPEEEISKESLTRLALVDFLRGLVEFDPGKRWSPLQVIHLLLENHSDVLINLPLRLQEFSYGSLGSDGSYNDSTGFGSSYGSYSDINSMHAYNSPAGPCGFNIHVQVGGQFLGSSPDARYRSQLSHGTGFGASPFGGVGPMSLGASPSQFTPPSSQMHFSSASPGKYGPTSPVRGSGRGILLGKAAAIGQYNKSWGYPTMCMQPYGSASERGPGFCANGMSCIHSDAQFQGHGAHSVISSSSHSNWKQQMGVGNVLSLSLTSANQKSYPAQSVHNSCVVCAHSLEVPCDKPEGSSSLPDPADWDPNYSDESLLQEDNAEFNSLNSEFTSCVCLGEPSDASTLTTKIGRYGHGHNQANPSSKFLSSNQRTDGLHQAYSLTESSPSTSHDVRAGNARPTQFLQNFPSRFGQQSVHRYNHVNSNIMQGERYNQYGQPVHSNNNRTDSHSSTNAMFSNSMPWGRRVGHSMTTTLPMPRSRKDYGKI
ncbi:dual specificity protein kinase YAK1 homolog isoform X5 [Musa acuminata AAA Group]|uniref:dual specificity protein kinase YAK1 homolog isoform X5 n=1 Tax=Musa acuminata AAA Group TaxID=214697 RepID=UPI0031D92D68